MMARSSRRSQSSSLRVNLSEVEERVRVPEGNHPVRVLEVTEEKSNNGPYLKWKFVVTGGEAEGGILYFNTSLLPQSLWVLKGLLRACGYPIPDDEWDLPLDEFVDLECMVQVDIVPWEDKKQSKVVDYGPLEKSRKKSKKRDDDEEEDEKPAKGKSRKAKEEEEEEEAPSRSSRGSKKSKKKSATPQDEIDGMDEDELADFVEEHELDVDLDDYKTLRKKRAAVIDAGVEAGVVEE
jgi:hypothetical protein